MARKVKYSKGDRMILGEGFLEEVWDNHDHGDGSCYCSTETYGIAVVGMAVPEGLLKNKAPKVRLVLEVLEDG